MSTSLPRSRTAVTTVADLLGDWPSCYRVLHPAYRVDGDEVRPTRWSEIADESGVTVDLADADWYAVGGQRLHTGPVGPVLEPEVGPVAGVLGPLVSLLAAVAGTGQVTVAEWTGYGSVEPGRLLVGATRQPDLVVGSEVHSVWRMSVATASGLIAGGSDVHTMGSHGVLANVISDVTGAWSIRADGDLASTYVGSRLVLTDWPAELEWVAVRSDARVS
ncbi:MAG: hypothetical protein ACR2LI_14930 [Propionibacteriaceae bacterium]